MPGMKFEVTRTGLRRISNFIPGHASTLLPTGFQLQIRQTAAGTAVNARATG